jgi:peptide/nickel transport system substrate-binding protein
MSVARIVRRLPVLPVAAALSLASWSAVAEDKTLRVAIHADLKNIDPIWTTALITQDHGYAVYDTLFALDDDFMPQPQMAEGYNLSDDGLTYTITLRAGLKWHDGTPVTAKDAVASIERWGKRDAMGQMLAERTASITASDDKTLVLTLKQPWQMTLTALGKTGANVPFIMPEAMAKTDPYKQVPEMTGSGPYKIVKDEWVPGSKVVYVKNEDYVPRDEPADNAAGGKNVHVDRMEWEYIPDSQTQVNALIAGEIDMIENVPADFVPLLEQSPGVTAEQTDQFGWQPWLVINHLNPPFDNVKARKALQLMVDQATYQNAVSTLEGSWRTCPAVFMCDTPYATDAGAELVMKQDLEQAKQLLKESGYNGEPVVLLHPTDLPALHAASVVTAALLRQIGVNVDDQAMDWSTLTSRRAETKPVSEGGWNLFHTAWSSSGLVNPLMHAGVSGACDKAWFGWPCDQELQDLRIAFSDAPDLAAQKEIAQKMQARTMEIVTYVPLGQYFYYRAYRENIKGIIPNAVAFFWNIEKN